mgnify:CR=1 FL=1
MPRRWWFHLILTLTQVDHFWGGGKPWALTSPRANYLKRLVLPATPITRCQRHLSNSIRQLKQMGHWDQGRGAPPKQHAVLPAPTVSSFQPGCPYTRQAFSPLALSRAAPGTLAQGLRHGRPGAEGLVPPGGGAASEAKARGKRRGDSRRRKR